MRHVNTMFLAIAAVALVACASSLPDVVEAMRDGRVDLMVTNATAARAQVMDFSGPLAEIDQGYLVMADSPFRTAADVDRDGVKVLAVQRSTTQGALPKVLQHATVVPAATIADAKDKLARRTADAFATQKSILVGMRGTAVAPPR